MNYPVLFKIANFSATIFWLFLIFLPNWKYTQKLVLSGACSLLLACSYLGLLLITAGEGEGGFFSLEAVMKIFDHPGTTLVGWIHYLAFDLFVGCWELLDSKKYKIKHIYMVPVLLATLMYGPVGLILYFGLRFFFMEKGTPKLPLIL